MSDGRGTSAGSAPGSGHDDAPRGGRTSRAGGGERRVLEGRVIPSQSDSPLPPQRQPGRSGHLPGAHNPRKAGAGDGGPDDAQAQEVPAAGTPGAQPSGAGPSGPLPDWDPPPPRPLPQRTPQAQNPQTAAQGGQRGQPQHGRTRPGPPGPPQDPGQGPPGPPLTPAFQPRGARRPDEPDWDALAAVNDRRSRRRRLLMAGGGVLAAAVVVAATLFLSGNDGGKGAEADASPSSGTGNGASGEPEFPDVTPPPPPDPLAVISSVGKDTAPLSVDTIFPGKRFTLGDRAYTEGPTSSTEDCASVAAKGLGPVLSDNGCRRMLRATYTRDGVSVTVGVAVFDDRKSADTVRKRATGHIAPLTGKGVGKFCTPVSCWSSTNAIGRYAYFTLAGLSDNKAVSSKETKAKQSGRDVSTFAFRQITQRGRDAAGQ